MGKGGDEGVAGLCMGGWLKEEGRAPRQAAGDRRQRKEVAEECASN